MAYLIEAIERAAAGTGSVTFVAGDDAHRATWSELYRDATRLAAILRGRGAGPGRPVAIIALTSRRAVTAALAGWLTGSSVTFMPTPARAMSQDVYWAETRRRLDALDGSIVLVGEPWKDAPPRIDGPGRTVVDLDDAFDAALSAPGSSGRSAAGISAVVPDDATAILQMTSGSTGSPKIVRISHAHLAANVEGIKQVDGHEFFHGRTVSWLPLSHDMGLIGALIVQMSCGRCDLVLSSPLDFLAQPARWMRLLSAYRATGTVAPNAAYAVAARLLAREPVLNLSSLRRAVTGAEPVDPEVMDAFVTAGARHGLNARCVQPAYGMAEATVAVTMAPADRGMRCDTVDATALERRGEAIPVPGHAGTDGGGGGEGGAVGSRRLALLGRPIPGLQLRIVDPDGAGGLPERRVGEIQVRGTSITGAYHNDPGATAELMTRDGWLHSGDLGYLAGGELVVTGRIKDVTILGGRNIYPNEVERAASRATGVRPGTAVAFAYDRPGMLSNEGLAVALETRAERTEDVRAEVLLKVREAIGITPHRVVVLPPGTVPKTPSGKPQRREAARRFGQ